MNYIELPPVRETTEDYDAIEELIKEFFKKEIYEPLLAYLNAPTKVLKNSISQLAQAILSGRIVFYRGQFKGRFSAALSRELYRIGAFRDLKTDSFRIQASKLPMEIRQAISQAEAKLNEALFKIDQRLASVVPEQVAEKLNLSDLFDKTLWKVDRELRGTLKSITVQPALSDKARKFIADEYSNNMKLYIQEWTEKETKTLRKDMQESVMSGRRYETMIKTIQKSYGVAERKARFLARQETNILMAKFKQSRYADAGIDEYTWHSVVGSPNHPVRPRHKFLNDERSRDGKKKIRKFSDPPIMDDGQKKNPGEDYGCRCTARPIIRQ